MEPDSTTSLSRDDGDAKNAPSEKDVSSGSPSKCMFCDKMLSKEEYLSHFKVRIFALYFINILYLTD